MRNITIFSFLALMLAGCSVPCYQETGTDGEVYCEDHFFSCDSGWNPAPPPAGKVCK